MIDNLYIRAFTTTNAHEKVKVGNQLTFLRVYVVCVIPLYGV